MAVPPVSGSWTNFGGTPGGTGQSVVQVDTTGDQQVAGHQRIPGNAYGAVPTDYTTAARAVFPHYDGTTGKTLPGPKPATFNDAAPADFLQWHTAFQLEKLIATGGTLAINVGGQTAYFLRSDDGQRVISTANMGKADIAKLTLSEQQRLIAIPALWAQLQNQLGVQTANSTLRNELFDNPNTGARWLINDATSTMSATDKNVFLNQIDIIADRFDKSAIADRDAIRLQLGEIVSRFNRANSFNNTPDPVNVRLSSWQETSGRNYYGSFQGSWNVGQAGASTDDNATIKNGYAEFMRAERQILASMETREATANSVVFKDPRMDVPNLIFRLQALYEKQAEGISDSGTEEIKQLHKLLADYGVMQRLVNETISFYNTKEQDETRRFMNIGTKNNNPDDIERNQRDGNMDWTTEVYHDGVFKYARRLDDTPRFWFGREIVAFSEIERNAIGMFSADRPYTFQTNRNHPLEHSAGVTRPTLAFMDDTNEGDGSLALLRKTKWDGFNTQLSDAITLLNQENQIKQNEVENASKRENRHFDLGNNALRKMNDMLLSIGRI